MWKPLARRESWLLLAAIAMVAIAAAFVLWRPTRLKVGVAPSGGTEPSLLRAYSEASATRDKRLRLEIVPFEGVRESAEALQRGEVDIAVVRPDVLMPANGLTLAVLRELAVLVAAPESAKLGSLPDLAGKRLGILANRTADRSLVATIVGHFGLELRDGLPAGPVPPDVIALVPLEEADLASAFATRRIDALVLVTTPTTPAARRIVGIVKGASGDGGVTLFGIPDVPAIIALLPRLQPATVPTGLYSGDPRIPSEDVPTVGSSYRLMARSTLSRPLAAEVTQHIFELRAGVAEKAPVAHDITPPAYETTAAATSARLPNHPGAIDYYEREQESFIERYESWIYLVAIFGGGLGSAAAWLRQRLGRIRRERIEVATTRLLEIGSKARRSAGAEQLHSFAEEIDRLAAVVARDALRRPAEARTLSAATIAIDSARSTVDRALTLVRSNSASAGPSN